MKKIVLLTMLFSLNMSWAQKSTIGLEQNTSKFISTLETRGVSSYFTTDRTCDAMTPRIEAKKACDTKESYLARYVFWKENGVTKMKLIDNCGMFTSYTLKDAAISDYYASNVQAIRTNELKPYVKESNNDAPIRRAGPNNCRRVYMFKSAEGAFVKKYNMFDLSSDASKKNVNAMHNNGLPLVKLDKMLDAAIAKMEANRAWIRM